MSKKQKTFRRVLTFVLAAVLALGFLSTVAFTVGAENGNINFDDLIAASRRGKCGENAIWSVDKNGVLTISGTGPMEMETSTAPWYKYKDEITAVVVGDGITSICDYAFMNLHYATSVSIGKDVRSIGEFAFNALLSLSSLTIPDNVKSIGSEAFGLCNTMKSVEIGDGVTFIDYWAFMNCDALETVTIGAGLESFDADLFDMCFKLKSIVFDSANAAYTSVDGVVYSKDKTALVYIPGGISGDFVIPTTVTEIREGALGDTYSLDTLTIPASVKKIEAQSDGDMGIVEKIYYIGSAAAWEKVEKINCEEFFSNRLAYRTKLAITTQPKMAVVASGKTVKVTIKATGDGLSYTWYQKSAKASKYSKTSVTGSTYSVKMSSSVSGSYVYCVVKDKYGNEVTSNVVRVYMGSPAKITTQPKSVKVAPGQTAKVTVKASGDGLSYTWYYKDAKATKYSKASVTGNTYSVKMSNSVNGRSVYCVVKDKYGTSVKTEEVSVQQGKAAKITTQPKSVVVENGKTAKVTIKATGDGLKYTWYYAKKGSSKYSKLSTTSTSYSVKMSSSVNGRKVYCVVTDKYGTSVKSSTVTLSLGKFAKITTQPKGVEVKVGKTAKLTLKATGDGLKYTWYYKNAGASKYSKTSGSKNTYSAKMTEAMDGRQVYCVVTDKYGNSVKSSVVTIKKVNTAKITTQPKSIAVENGKTAKVTIKATGDGLKYTWYYAKKGSSKYTKVSGSSATYSVKMSSSVNGRKVYCVVKDKHGTSVKSSVVTLSMRNYAKVTAQPKNVVVIVGKTASITFKATGDGLKYTWYYKDAGASKYSKASVTKDTYSAKMTDAMDGRQVYCVITDQYGKTAKTAVVTIKKANLAKITTQPKNATVPSGSTAKVTVKATGDGLTYTWYYAKKGSTKYTKLSTTSATYSVKMSSSVNGRKVYCVVKDKYGTSVKSSVVTLYMGNPVKITTQPKNVTVEEGVTAKVSVKATGDGLKYQWYYKNPGSASFKKYAAGTAATYSTKMSTGADGRQVYCVVTDKYGNTAKSSVATLTMEEPIYVDFVKGSWEYTGLYCEGEYNTFDFTFYNESEGFVSVAYWQVLSQEEINEYLEYGWSMEDFRKIEGEYYVNFHGTWRDFTYTVKGNTVTISVEWGEDGEGAGTLVLQVQKDKSLKIVSHKNFISDPALEVGKSLSWVEPVPEPIEMDFIKKPLENVMGNYGDTLTVTVEAEGEDLTYVWWEYDMPKPGEEDTGENILSDQTGATYTMVLTPDNAGREVFCVVFDKDGNYDTSNGVTLDYIAPAGWVGFASYKVTEDKQGLYVSGLNAAGRELNISKWRTLKPGETPVENGDDYKDQDVVSTEKMEIDGVDYHMPFGGWWKPVELSLEEGLVKVSIQEGEEEVAAIYLERTDFDTMVVVRTTGTISDIPGYIESFTAGDVFTRGA